MIRERRKSKITTKNLARISLLGSMAMILMLFSIPIFFAPSFMKIDFSDVPALLGAYAMGPVAGVFIHLIKNILKFLVKGSSTGGVGELSNFIVGSSFVLAAGFYYRWDRTLKGALIATLLGVLTMTFTATLSNYYFIFPLYSKFMPIEKMVEMASRMNNFVVDYKSMIFYSVVPFNLLKGFINGLITILIYKKTSRFLKD